MAKLHSSQETVSLESLGENPTQHLETTRNDRKKEEDDVKSSTLNRASVNNKETTNEGVDAIKNNEEFLVINGLELPEDNRTQNIVAILDKRRDSGDVISLTLINVPIHDKVLESLSDFINHAPKLRFLNIDTPLDNTAKKILHRVCLKHQGLECIRVEKTPLSTILKKFLEQNIRIQRMKDVVEAALKVSSVSSESSNFFLDKFSKLEEKIFFNKANKKRVSALKERLNSTLNNSSNSNLQDSELYDSPPSPVYTALFDSTKSSPTRTQGSLQEETPGAHVPSEAREAGHLPAHR